MKKLQIKTILVPIDFSKMSASTIEAANNLAQRLGANVHLTHIEAAYPGGFRVMPAPFPTAPGSWPGDITAEFRAAEWRELDRLAARFGIPSNHCHLREGLPVFDEICRVAGEIRADLIVMPTHGWSGLKHTFLGSTAERVVQHAPCPVLISRGKLRTIDKILVPVDFSDCSLDALKAAIALAERVAAKIIVTHAVYLDLAYTADGYAMYDLQETIDRATRAAEAEMKSFIRKAKFGTVKSGTRVTAGSPVTEICEVAKDERVDLIVTPTHGLTGLKHLLTGSVAERVVRHAPCSVLVVPSHPAERRRLMGKVAKRGGRKQGAVPRQKAARPEAFTRRSRRVLQHAFPERRKTNKFRESHQFVRRGVSRNPV
jgi:nucleotide-binding universal stress UspA family protein